MTLWLSIASTGAVLSLSRAFLQPSASETLANLAHEAATLESTGNNLVDTYGAGTWLQGFEEEMAAELGKERAVFVPTGVCAQLMALAVHCQDEQ